MDESGRNNTQFQGLQLQHGSNQNTYGPSSILHHGRSVRIKFINSKAYTYGRHCSVSTFLLMDFVYCKSFVSSVAPQDDLTYSYRTPVQQLSDVTRVVQFNSRIYMFDSSLIGGAPISNCRLRTVNTVSLYVTVAHWKQLLARLFFS